MRNNPELKVGDAGGGRRDGPVHRFLAADHARLDGLLGRAVASPDALDPVPFAQFRAGILRHIGIEEKVLLPEAQACRGGEPLPIAARLRLDHGAIAALLVPTPTRAVVAALRSILDRHNEIEEEPGGLYDECDRLFGGDDEEGKSTAARVMARLQAYPEVRLAPHVDGPRVFGALSRALGRAGYESEAEAILAEAAARGVHPQ
jgi:hypothetical protein